MDVKYLECFKTKSINTVKEFWTKSKIYIYIIYYKNKIEEDICPICHGRMIEKTANDACQHKFCFTCILSRVKINNICPLCRRTIMKLNKI